MTDLTGATDLRHFNRAFAASNRLRTLGTDNLLAAARESGVKRLIARSYCGWPYVRSGVAVKADDLDPEPPEELRPSLEAIRYLAHEVISSSQPEGVVLR
jgi:hypothetical protein